MHPYWGLVALTSIALAGCSYGVAATDEPVSVPVCDAAFAQLTACGLALDESPFGTCQPAQREQAESLLSLYDAQGCVGLTDTKADGAGCGALSFLCVEHSPDELVPFRTDGCSMFPDGIPGDRTRWLHCCVEHDMAYYVGGPREARTRADAALATCVAEQTNDVLGELMYVGVRVGGTPALPMPWRWGYGWTYDPTDGYRDLGEEEAAAAEEQLAIYLDDPVPPDAFEQRALRLWDHVFHVPGLADAIEDIEAEAMTYED